MASISRLTLHSGQVTNNTNGLSFALEGLQTDFSGLLKVTQLGGNSTITVKIQASPDNATWLDWILFTQRNTLGSECIIAPPFVLTYVRAVFIFAPAGGPKTCTATVDLYFDKKR